MQVLKVEGPIKGCKVHFSHNNLIFLMNFCSKNTFAFLNNGMKGEVAGLKSIDCDITYQFKKVDIIFPSHRVIFC